MTFPDLHRLSEAEGGGEVPVPEPSGQIAFIGVFHGEGPERLEPLLWQAHQWFGGVFVSLQGGTDDERAVCEDMGVTLLESPTMGFSEATYQDVMNAAHRAGFAWVFNLDGDELADPTLLASLPWAIQDPNVMQANAARVPRRNTFEIPPSAYSLHGRMIVPGFNESNARLHRSDLTRPRVVHSDLLGTRTKPHPWHDFGAIRQHRTVDEYVRDQLRFREIAVDKTFATGRLVQLQEQLSQFLFESEVDDLMGEEAMYYIDQHKYPQGSWED